jgi:coenzyme F420-reducing hydrogenase beta subunit
MLALLAPHTAIFVKALLNENIITHVISITHDKGLEYTPKLLQNVKDMPTSIYHNVNFQKAFELIKDVEGKFVIIGLPCQITSIELLLNKKKYQKFREKIILKIALFCGHVMEYNNIEYLAEEDKINFSEIIKVQYRGEGWLKKIFLYTKKIIKKHYLSKSLFDRLNNRMVYDKFLKQNGCLWCVDHIGYNADIVVGDAWHKSKKNNDGQNIIVFRDRKSLKYLKYLKNFCLEEDSLKSIIISQKKMFAYAEIANYLYLNVKNKFKPNHNINRMKSDYKIPFYDMLKFKIVKKLMRKKYFKIAKSVYFILWVFEIVDIKFIKRILKR